MSRTNEERSADWAAAFLANARVNAASIERIRRHILATRHAEEPEDPDSKLVVDIDLGILGSDPGRYDEFERQVRREYKWVPGPLYRRVRAEILRSFLDRSVIYSHMPLRERFEAQARENLTRSLQRLAGRE
jgi:predicted metal-dependent HD superfamily phosphohydrolase